MTWHRKIPGQAACGPCCGIKEKLQTLWDRTINSILRINQVEPDDQGNIRITSDSEALTVTEGTNEIILGLDTSELPAAAVTSVNGETGAVQLTGDDIPSLYNGTVNSNIAGLWGTKAQTSALNTEISNRQQADTTLQNNINALQASIPQEAADAVAADPTVQSFAAAAADIPNKVDKRTGSGLRAYTHDGSTQDDTPVIDGTTGTTIPIRDTNGYLKATSPATGVYDNNLANGTKVKNELDNYAPMIRTANNQKKSGVLWVNDINSTAIKNTGSDAYFIFARLNSAAITTTRFSLILSSRGPYESGYYCLWASTATTMTVVTAATQPASFKIVTDGTYQYFAVLVQNNNIKRITFIDQMDAFDRALPDMTLFSPYPVTTETDVMVSQ